MEVKIYREPENENLILDENQLQEYNSIASELGLCSFENAEKKQTPNVYICLNAAMRKQLKALCPVSVEAEKYRRTTIPLEVLKVYKFAKDNEMFDGFYVWYADKEPDPLLIGWKWQSEEAKIKDYSWQKDEYLIARWGDCAMELPELLRKGYESIKSGILESAKLAVEKATSIVNSPDTYTKMFLSGKSINIEIETSGDINLPF